MKFTQRMKFLHSIDGVNYSLDLFESINTVLIFSRSNSNYGLYIICMRVMI